MNRYPGPVFSLVLSVSLNVSLFTLLAECRFPTLSSFILFSIFICSTSVFSLYFLLFRALSLSSILSFFITLFLYIFSFMSVSFFLFFVFLFPSNSHMPGNRPFLVFSAFKRLLFLGVFCMLMRRFFAFITNLVNEQGS